MVISELKRTQSDLREQIGRLEREAGELSGERDRLNWTMGVILEHQNFPVAFRCPNRGEPDRQTDTVTVGHRCTIIYSRIFVDLHTKKRGAGGLQGLCQCRTWCDCLNTLSQTGRFTGYVTQKNCIVKLCFLILDACLKWRVNILVMFYRVFVIHQIYIFSTYSGNIGLKHQPILSQTSSSVLVDYVLQPHLPLLSVIKQMVLFLYS